jgi:hypothetical protein
VGRLGSEIAAPISDALERVRALDTSGRIDRQGLRSLRESLETVRRQAAIAQQLARIGHQALRLAPEPVELQRTVDALLRHRARDLLTRGITLEPRLTSVGVATDPALLFSLVNAMLDWAVETTPERIVISSEGPLPGVPARLQMRVETGTPTAWPEAHGEAASSNESLNWLLVEALAQALGTSLEWADGPAGHWLAVEFRALPSGAVDPDDGFAPTANPRPLEGALVLVIVSRRELRQDVLRAVRPMGLLLDFVRSLAEAASYCRDTLPHAVIYEATLAGAQMSALRDELLEEMPGTAFIEITEGHDPFEPSSFGGTAVARVGREQLDAGLPTALLFETSRGL